jgi:L-fucose isomerase-like protein
MQERARIGLVMMRSLGMHLPQVEDLLKRLQRNQEEIVSKLESNFDVAGYWVVDTDETLGLCVKGLKLIDFDLMILVYLNKGDDRFLAPLLETIGSTPFVAWCYVPWRRIPKPLPYSELVIGSGAIGMFGAFAYLRDLNIPFQFTYGSPDDPKVMRDLLDYARAAQIVRSLRSVKIGVTTNDTRPAASTEMTGSLRAVEGIQIQQISYRLIAEEVEKVNPEEIRQYLAEIEKFGCAMDVPEFALDVSARLSVAIRSVAEDNHFDLFAIPDNPHGVRGTIQVCPGLPPDPKEIGLVAYQTEFDLGLSLAHLILRRLSGSPAFLIQIWFWDKATNIIMGGHSGIQSLSIADPSQVCVVTSTYCEDEDCMEGAQLQYIAHSGRVTLLQLRPSPNGWRAIALSGFCLESDPWIEGIPHAVVRLDGTIDYFLEEVARLGVSRDWVMAYGDVFPQLQAVCEMMGITFEALRH